MIKYYNFNSWKIEQKKIMKKKYTGKFTSDNEPDGIENATHNTFLKKVGYEIKISIFFRQCIVSCIFNSVGLIITRE
jgi:hypothetical protein